MRVAGPASASLRIAAPNPLPPAGEGLASFFARLSAWRDRTLASPDFRAWAARFPLTRPIARRRSRALFDLCAGFVYSQVLQSCVQLDLFNILHVGPQTPGALASRLGLTVERTERLCEAAAGLTLLRRRGDAYGLGPLGAAMIGNDGVAAMVRHHAILYRDLADPVGLFRGTGSTGLAAYWPYGAADDPAALPATTIAAYSVLMAESQPLVAAEILSAYDISRHRRLLDVGGGEGAFLEQAAARAPTLQLWLFDLPEVAARAARRLGSRVTVAGGDMRRHALPTGADLLTLIRVIHDHDDELAMAILRNIRAATPADGTLLLAEPMLDAPGAEAVGAYFAMYLLALGSGRPRRQAELMSMLTSAGFGQVRPLRTGNAVITSLIVAKP